MKRILFAAVTAATFILGMLPSSSFAQTDFQFGIGVGDGGDWRYRHHHNHHCRWVQVWHHHHLVWVKQCGWGRYGDQYGEHLYGGPDYGPPDYGPPDDEPNYGDDYENPYN